MRLYPVARASGLFSVLACCALSLSCGGGGFTQKVTGPPELTKIVISPTNKSIAEGTTLQLTATGVFSDGTQKDLTASATWQVTPTAVAKINAQGNLTGLTQGAAQVSAATQGVTGDASVSVGPPVLISIAVDAKQSSLPLGESETVTATGTFSDGSTQDLTQSVAWQASPSTVAKINSQGNLTSLAQGSAQVSAAYQGITGNVSVTVGPAALLRITVSATQSSLPLGKSESLTATGSFSDGSTQDLTASVTWQASPPAVATINAQGDLTSLAQGSAQVSATYQGITGNTSITIGTAALMSLAVNATQSSLPLGESELLTATGSFSDGTTKNLSSSVTWKASPSTVARISTQGSLTGLVQGTAEVSAVSQGITGNISVTIGSAALMQIAVSPNQSSLPLGESEPLTATGSFSDGTTQNLTSSVKWTSAVPGIAGVSSAGAVVGKSVGTATINATFASVTGVASLTVMPAVIVALNISPATLSLVISNSSQFQATATLSDGTTQNLTGAVTWSSGTPNILNVTNGGLVTGVQVGAGTLLARTTSGSFKASASVTVTPLMTVSYFNRANAVSSGYDGTIRLTNPGVTTGYSDGNLCAMVYVFDRNQELNECCGCTISDNGLRTLSVVNDLTANPLSGKVPVAGSIEIVPSEPGSNGQCNAGSPDPNGVILGWETNVQGMTGAFQVTEMPLLLVPLGNTEAKVLASECSMLEQLGSGAGVCTCGSGGD
jgi:hypothetical protein